MRVLRREDYENLAKEAVAKMVNNNVPLSSSLVKIADSMGLNPDQIRALVQVANTLAHLDLFDRKTDGDKVVSFSPADPDVVIREVVTNGDNASKPCSSASDKIPDFFGPIPAISTAEPAGTDSTDSSALADVGNKVITDMLRDPEPRRQQIMIIKIRKVAEELKQQKLAARIRYEEERDKLAAEFASLYGPSFQEFEKDAVDVHGADAIPLLSELRRMLRLPQIKVAVYEKTARLVDSDTPTMRSFSRMKSLAEEEKAYAAGLTLLEREVGGVL